MNRLADPRHSLLASSRLRPWEYGLWAAILLAPLVLPQHALLVSEIAITALFALSLDLILGYAGIVSLGHAAFFGFGAYTAALFAKFIHPDPLFGLAIGCVAAAVLGLIFSLSILRGTDLTRLMVTMGASLLLGELANKLDWLTGGADGLQGVVMGKVLGLFEFDLGGQVAAYYALAVLLLCFWGARHLVHAPLGASLMAVRDNRLRAMAIGVPVNARLIFVYTLAAALAGAAGSLQAQTTGFASLDVFSLERSADLVLILVIGGTGWLYGGVLGAVAFKLLHQMLSSITPQYWTFWIGLFLVVLMLVGRERLLKPWTWWRRA